MNLFDWNLFIRLLSNTPDLPNLKRSHDSLSWEALTRCVFVAGAPSSGKTYWMANHLVDYAIEFPDRGVLSIDIKGSLTKEVQSIVLRKPPEVRDALIKRLRLDALGDQNWVLPTPEFSLRYGFTMEELVTRVVTNLKRINHELIEKNPTMGEIPISEVGTNIFRLLTAVRNDMGECLQITDAKNVIMDGGLRKDLTKEYGKYVPAAKWYFDTFFEDLTPSEMYKRTAALVSVLGDVETPFARAKLGYQEPRVTPKEVIERGLIYLVDGSGLANHEPSRDYLVMQIYSLFKAEIDKRIPDNPDDKPFSIFMDEVVSIFKVPQMAPEIAAIPSQNRSRKLQLYIAVQELNQISKDLRDSIWSMGNVVCFAIANVHEAEEIARQLFPYVPTDTKLPAKTDTQQPITEVYGGQDRKRANIIQRLPHRQCLIRYYKTERDLDRFIHWVARTTEVSKIPVDVWELRDRLLKEHGIALREALKEVNNRNPGGPPPTSPANFK